jgi:small ligand-binding sensory domain FIST
MTFAAALSEHPIAAQAVGEAAGELLERIGAGADLVTLFATAAHTGTLEDIAGAVRDILRPGLLLGTTAVAVVSGRREVEETPGLALWAGRLPGRVTPVRLEAVQGIEGWSVAGLDDDRAATARTLLLVPDPFSFPTSTFLAELAARHPHLAVIGGLASAAHGPGGNRLVLDGAVLTEGAVGALLDDDASPEAIVSQGCRPIGQPFIVTRAERNVIYELAGRPALERLLEMVEALSPEDRSLAARGLHCGLVIDERKLEFRRGDFLIRGVIGADRANGAVAVGDEVPVGATVQFQVRDAASADEDLRELLVDRVADAALLFTCNGRGVRLFGERDHDAATVGDLLATSAVGGMFCAGELGPIGGRNHVHGFTASVALFREEPGTR